MKSILRSLFFVLVLLAVTRCGDSASHTSSTPAASPASTLAAKIIIGSEANEFKVRLNWNANEHVKEWSISRKAASGVIELDSLSQSETLEYEDTEVVPGETYTYQVTSSPGQRLIGEATVTIPQDVAAKTVHDLLNRGPIYRLFLSKDSVITTNGKDLTLEVKYLISDDGVIQSFPEGTRADEGTNGRTGGNIKIKAERAKGNLTVLLNGQDGGVGRDGKTGMTGNVGADGTKGEWILNEEVTKGLQQNVKDSYRRLPDELPNWGPERFIQPFWICGKAPTDGAKGGQGGAGEDGGRGGNGGDRGKLELTAKDQEEFVLTYNAEPGRGALGGRGGIGGKGGKGGNPGALDRLHKCPAAKAGPEGDVGIAGRQGVSGYDGR